MPAFFKVTNLMKTHTQTHTGKLTSIVHKPFIGFCYHQIRHPHGEYYHILTRGVSHSSVRTAIHPPRSLPLCPAPLLHGSYTDHRMWLGPRDCHLSEAHQSKHGPDHCLKTKHRAQHLPLHLQCEEEKGTSVQSDHGPELHRLFGVQTRFTCRDSVHVQLIFFHSELSTLELQEMKKTNHPIAVLLVLLVHAVLLVHVVLLVHAVLLVNAVILVHAVLRVQVTKTLF